MQRLERLNRRFKREVDGVPAPDRNDEWLFYQTLLGAWPLELASPKDLRAGALDDLRTRLDAYMHKAIREAKRRTSWSNPHVPYEEAVSAFVRAVLDEAPGAPLWSEFFRIAEPVARIGMLNGLAQATVKFTALRSSPTPTPGRNSADFSLKIDPDNRRLVDWGARERLLRQIPDEAASPEFATSLLNRWRDGHVKLFVTRTLLRLRRARRAGCFFSRGDYNVALETAGQRAENIVAFAVAGTVVAVPRLIGGLLAERDGFPLGPPVWETTRVALPRRRSRLRYHDVFTGRAHQRRRTRGRVRARKRERTCRQTFHRCARTRN